MFDHYVFSLLCAKHYGKWPTKGPEVSKTQWAGSRELTTQGAHHKVLRDSSQLGVSIFLILSKRML